MTVTVNRRQVVLNRHEAAGAQIKAAAIDQGVPIQPDFALFEDKGQGNLKTVGDKDVLILHEDETFRAVAPDDNS